MEYPSKSLASQQNRMLKHPMEILLIEDEPAHAELIQRAFEQRAPEVHIQCSPTLSHARAYLSENRPSLIITDWHLPDGDGLELLAGSDNRLLFPVIFMTSYGNERVAVEAIKAGALDYVVKFHESLMDMPHIAERAFEPDAAKDERMRIQKALTEGQAYLKLLCDRASVFLPGHDEHGKFL